MYGAKVIGCRRCTLDIHGRPLLENRTWTRLSATAEAGATSMCFMHPVDWPPYSQIIVTSTGFDMNEIEQRTTTSLTHDGRCVTFLTPLRQQHLGVTRYFNGHAVEMRAEAGLLSRNVVIQGNDRSPLDRHGGTIMFYSEEGARGTASSGANANSFIGRIENAELRYMGQAFQLGRYAVHFHMSGLIDQSYLRLNSIHHTYNRACTIHGVHGLRVQDNVAYDNMGHAFFFEDSVETKNVVTGNLGALTKPSFAMANTDQTPATFWITNPDNYVNDNVAAGSQNYGFWFDVAPGPRGASVNCVLGDPICPTTTAMCPQHTTILQFRDNAAHSNLKYGLRFYHTVGGFWPRQTPCQPAGTNNRWEQAKVERYFGWRNAINGVTVTRIAALALIDSQFVDNLVRGVEMPGVTAGKEDKQHFLGRWGDNEIKGSLFVGFVPETEALTTLPPFASSSAPFRVPRITDGQIQHCPAGTGARNSESGFGCERDRLGLETQAWHRLVVRNTTFANYKVNAAATAGFARPELYRGGGGWESQFERITWENAQRRVRWRWQMEGFFTE